MSLLSKAKALKGHIHNRRLLPYTKEEMELALAWATNEISGARVKKILGNKSQSHLYVFLACALRQWISQGMQDDEKR